VGFGTLGNLWKPNNSKETLFFIANRLLKPAAKKNHTL
jgi:hypothetical protein